MLIVETIARIRREHLVKGKSIKQIARELKLSRNTVRRVLRSGETAFSYVREVQPRPKLGVWTKDLDRLLMMNATAASRERLTLIRIFEELRSLGYAGGYDAVRRYARRWSREHASATAEAFVPLSFAPGEAYQFDSHGALKVKRLIFVGRCSVVRKCAFARGPGQRRSICRHLLLAAKMASARRGSRMRSTGEAGTRNARILDARLVVSPTMSPSANGACPASIPSRANTNRLAIHGLSHIA
jgi:transposase